jgi:hypothetical protein
MGKKSGKNPREFELDEIDDFDDLDDLDVKGLSRDIYSAEWDDEYEEKQDRADARRKIERRRDMKRLYSELNDWEEFGLNEDWR